MSSYSLRTRADGQTEVIEHTEAVLGTFARSEHARQFYDWMAGRHYTIKRAPEPEILPAAPQVEPASAIQPDHKQQGTERSGGAFDRLDVGEPLEQVARSMKISPASLGELDGALVRRDPPQVNDQESCRLCTRMFTPSAVSPDLCARCARGV